MHVVATAGHVDHGKSTLLRALTGMEPDRWAEERRRGMTLDLGFVWTTSPDGEELAFVDVPGHERFVPTMLAGAGPVPAALLVVAADGGWMPQSAEHLAALTAFGVRHAVLAVTRSDLADPSAALAEAQAELAGTPLAGAEAVTLSATTGEGIPHLRAALARLVAALPEPDVDAPVRLWVDRSFTIDGSGTVVTGTLGAGTVRVGDRLRLGDRLVVVRGVQALGRPRDAVRAVARVAVNLRGVERSEVRRGDSLLTPGAFVQAWAVDVRLVGRPPVAPGRRGGGIPERLVLHVGSAAVPVRVRLLGEGAARLALTAPLPLRAGDRCVLRDPGGTALLGAQVDEVDPLPLRRRGEARERGARLAAGITGADVLAARRWLPAAELAAMGHDVPLGALRVGPWVLAPGVAEDLGGRLEALVDDGSAADPLSAGLPLDVARQRLGLPEAGLVEVAVRPPLEVRDGRVRRAGAGLPPDVAAAWATLKARLDADPFAAPDAEALSALGLGPAQVAVLVRAGVLLRIGDVLLLPSAPEEAAARLESLEQPFTAAQAKQAWGTSRRVALPLLGELDRRGVTRRGADDRRVLTQPRA